MKILDLQSTSDLTKVVNYLGSEDSKKIISACIKKIVLSNLIKTKDKPFYKQLEFMKPITIFYSLEGNKFYFNKVKDEKKTFLFDDLLKLSAIDLSKKIMSSERKNEIAETLSVNNFNFDKLSSAVSDFVEEEIMPVIISEVYVMLLNFKTVEDFARSDFLDDFLNGQFPARLCHNLFGSLGRFIFNDNSDETTQKEIRKFFRQISKIPEKAFSSSVLEEFLLFKNELKERMKLLNWFNNNIDDVQSTELIEHIDYLLIINEWIKDVNKPLEVYEQFYGFIFSCYRVLLRLEEEFNSIEKQSQDLILKELSIFKVGLRNTVDNVTKPERDYGFVFKRGVEILFEKIDKIEEMAI
jgi:hypothetical protein